MAETKSSSGDIETPKIFEKPIVTQLFVDKLICNLNAGMQRDNTLSRE